MLQAGGETNLSKPVCTKGNSTEAELQLKSFCLLKVTSVSSLTTLPCL